MIFEIVPLTREHLLSLADQKPNSFIHDWMESGHADEMIPRGFAGVMNGHVMICGGVIELWKHRAQVWSIFNQNSKTCFLPVFRGIKKFLQAQPYRRLEFSVPVNLPIAHRRALLLGFKLECALAEKYLPNGEDCAIYALVRSV